MADQQIAFAVSSSLFLFRRVSSVFFWVCDVRTLRARFFFWCRMYLSNSFSRRCLRFHSKMKTMTHCALLCTTEIYGSSKIDCVCVCVLSAGSQRKVVLLNAMNGLLDVMRGGGPTFVDSSKLQSHNHSISENIKLFGGCCLSYGFTILNDTHHTTHHHIFSTKFHIIFFVSQMPIKLIWRKLKLPRDSCAPQSTAITLWSRIVWNTKWNLLLVARTTHILLFPFLFIHPIYESRACVWLCIQLSSSFPIAT